MRTVQTIDKPVARHYIADRGDVARNSRGQGTRQRMRAIASKPSIRRSAFVVVDVFRTNRHHQHPHHQHHHHHHHRRADKINARRRAQLKKKPSSSSSSSPLAGLSKAKQIDCRCARACARERLPFAPQRKSHRIDSVARRNRSQRCEVCDCARSASS